ncbi:hypothetical protein [Liberibacter crescens]|uniref:hypothetical protein n=1 Tax=Liberibacter crescens TaxID=1273132 RepID=UPI00059EE133|nr:hypothetical protein [Liberibacter crescens]AMC12669.1 hypothetical protein RL73_02705 [Liberibacter crescens]
MKQHRKAWWRSKTIWFNTGVLFVCTIADNVDRLNGLVGDHLFRVLAFVLPVTGVMLRLMTTQGVHSGKDDGGDETS